MLERAGIKFEFTVQPVDTYAKCGDQATDLYREEYGDDLRQTSSCDLVFCGIPGV
jgi:hypothetical protein